MFRSRSCSRFAYLCLSCDPVRSAGEIRRRHSRICGRAGRTLFAAKLDVLYDLTSTYFESPLPDYETDKRRMAGPRYTASLMD
jgi:hypothetical protein